MNSDNVSNDYYQREGVLYFYELQPILGCFIYVVISLNHETAFLNFISKLQNL
jgi:hypothetical protein